jgi:hypothetical protein
VGAAVGLDVVAEAARWLRAVRVTDARAATSSDARSGVVRSVHVATPIARYVGAMP